MPAKSARQYGLMGAAAAGKVAGIAPSVGAEFVKKTAPNKRKAFTKALRRKRK